MTSILAYLPYAVVAAVIIVRLLPKSIRQKINPFRRRSPRPTQVLLTTIGIGVINQQTGITPQGYPYMYFIGLQSLFSAEATIGMYTVELPFSSGAHIVGIPKNPSEHIELPELNQLDPLVLEGDYPNYFDAYTTKDGQTQARYVLDPKAMIFTVDFCKQYHWEIVDDTLYFISGATLPDFAIVDTFVKEIRPAIELPAGRTKNAHKLPTAFMHGRVLKCPQCDEKLFVGDSWMECPNKHGALVTAKQMLKARDTNRNIDTLSKLKSTAKEAIHCPYCTHKMTQSRYQMTDIIIDVCPKCPHRWIDSNEISAVIGL